MLQVFCGRVGRPKASEFLARLSFSAGFVAQWVSNEAGAVMMYQAKGCQCLIFWCGGAF